MRNFGPVNGCPRKPVLEFIERQVKILWNRHFSTILRIHFRLLLNNSANASLPDRPKMATNREVSMIASIPKSPARAVVERALARIERGLQESQQTRDDARAANSALDGYQPEVRAIEFDRPDRNVSAHGRALQGKVEISSEPANRGLQTSQELQAGGGEIRESIDQALAALTSAEAGARSSLTRAQADTKLMNENSLPHLSLSFRQAHRQSQQELSPYLTEVVEDQPGRDVGRFADDIGELFADAQAHFRQGDLSGKFVAEDLATIQVSLQRAREKLK